MIFEFFLLISFCLIIISSEGLISSVQSDSTTVLFYFLTNSTGKIQFHLWFKRICTETNVIVLQEWLTNIPCQIIESNNFELFFF